MTISSVLVGLVYRGIERGLSGIIRYGRGNRFTPCGDADAGLGYSSSGVGHDGKVEVNVLDRGILELGCRSVSLFSSAGGGVAGGVAFWSLCPGFRLFAAGTAFLVAVSPVVAAVSVVTVVSVSGVATGVVVSVFEVPFSVTVVVSTFAGSAPNSGKASFLESLQAIMVADTTTTASTNNFFI